MLPAVYNDPLVGETDMEEINIVQAKKQFSELLNEVAQNGKNILITKRGKPIARLAPVREEKRKLGDVKGWLENDDPFFEKIDRLVENRLTHIPRVLTGENKE